MWLFSGRCNCTTRLDGKTVVITGANCGIGKATALELVRRGARVIIACRNLSKAEEAADDIKNIVKSENGTGQIAIVKLDLSSLASVRECAQHLLRTESKIHILINNAGLCFVEKGTTVDGFELQMGINHLGHFLLTCLLLPRLIRSAPARIVILSSCSQNWIRTLDMEDLAWEKRSYNKRTAYFESKLANVLFNTELSLRLKGKEVTTYAVHPGLVVTNSARYLSWVIRFAWEKVLACLLKTPEQGCQTSVHCAVAEQLARQSGLYYSDCKISEANRKVHDEDFRCKFWEESARLVGLGSWDPFTAQDNGELPPDTRKQS